VYKSGWRVAEAKRRLTALQPGLFEESSQHDLPL